MEYIYIGVIVISVILLALSGSMVKIADKWGPEGKLSKVSSKMELLYAKKSAARESRAFILKSMRCFLIIVGLSAMCSLLYSGGQNNSSDKLDKYIVNRPAPGEEDISIDVNVVSKSGSKICKIPIKIESQKYTDEELDRFVCSLAEYLRTEILNGNVSAMHIVSDLKLPGKVEGYPFDITWRSKDPAVISDAGKISVDWEEESRTQIPVTFSAVYTYKDYRAEDKYEFILAKPVPGKKERLIKSIESAVEDAMANSGSNRRVVLPQIVEGVEIAFELQRDKTDIYLFILGFVVAALSLFVRKRSIDEEIEKRNEQMLSDYPKIVSRYVLYYCAGVNTRSIWKLICDNYQNRKEREKRYAYEEMVTANRAMEEGMSEIKAYEMFAYRCGLSKYKTFVNLIEQVISNGNKQVKEMMEEEVNKAGKERINRAKVNGEKAATKLLIPMIMMLLCVIVIVIVPAFVGMNG